MYCVGCGEQPLKNFPKRTRDRVEEYNCYDNNCKCEICDKKKTFYILPHEVSDDEEPIQILKQWMDIQQKDV